MTPSVCIDMHTLVIGAHFLICLKNVSTIHKLQFSEIYY